jgi:hypothetical protein
MRSLIAIALLCFAHLARGQDNFPEVPKWHDTLYQLLRMPGAFDKSAVILGSFDQQRLGAAATRSLEHIRENVSKAEKLRDGLAYLPKQSPAYQVLSREREPLVRLLSEWKEKRVLAELRDIFGALRAYKDSGRGMRECEETSRELHVALSAPVKVQQLQIVEGKGVSGSFPDLPENHSLLEAFARLKAMGILVGYPDDKRGNWPLTNARLRLNAIRTLDGVREVYRNLSQQRHAPGRGSIDALGTALVACAIFRTADVLGASKSFRTFERRFRMAGHALAGLEFLSDADLDKPFSDVEAGHWAASAVGELRRKRILIGYGGNRFSSGR